MAKKKLVLEDAFAELDKMVHKLEEEELSLEESFRTYKDGMDLLKQCSESIDGIEKEIRIINEDGTEDGTEDESGTITG